MNLPRRARLSNRTRIVLVVIVATVLGFLSQFQILGQIAVGLYGILAILRQIPGRTTFILALMALATLPVAIVAGRGMVATNFATYTFLLFVVGAVQIVIELWDESKVILEEKRRSSR